MTHRLRARFRAVFASVVLLFALAFGGSSAYAYADLGSPTHSPPGLELLADLPALPAADQLRIECECAQSFTYHGSAGGVSACRTSSYIGAQLTRAVQATGSNPKLE